MDHPDSDIHSNIHSVNLFHDLSFTCCGGHSGQERCCAVLDGWIIAAFAWLLTRFAWLPPLVWVTPALVLLT